MGHIWHVECFRIFSRLKLDMELHRFDMLAQPLIFISQISPIQAIEHGSL